MRRHMGTSDGHCDPGRDVRTGRPRMGRFDDRKRERSEILLVLGEAGFGCDLSLEGVLDRLSLAGAGR